MHRNFLASTAAAAVIGLFGFVTAPAHADTIVVNQWYSAFFAETGSPLTGTGSGVGTNGPVPGGFVNAVALPAGSTDWTITLTTGAYLRVTDLETSGDQFRMFDNASLLGATSTPVANAEFGVFDINYALGDSNYSSGLFFLAAGSHDISGIFDGVITFGDMAFAVVTTPLPATLPLFAGGLGALGLLGWRRKRKNAAALAAA